MIIADSFSICGIGLQVHERLLKSIKTSCLLKLAKAYYKRTGENACRLFPQYVCFYLFFFCCLVVAHFAYGCLRESIRAGECGVRQNVVVDFLQKSFIQILKPFVRHPVFGGAPSGVGSQRPSGFLLGGLTTTFGGRLCSAPSPAYLLVLYCLHRLQG